MVADFVYLVAQGDKILERRGLLVGIAEQRRGMEGTHIEYTVAVIEEPVLFCDTKVLRDISLGGYPADADDYLRVHQIYLAVEPCGARLLLLGQGIAVLRRAALDGVRDIDIPVPEQVNGRH